MRIYDRLNCTSSIIYNIYVILYKQYLITIIYKINEKWVISKNLIGYVMFFMDLIAF